MKGTGKGEDAAACAQGGSDDKGHFGKALPCGKAMSKYGFASVCKSDGFIMGKQKKQKALPVWRRFL
jgi:hypothetical protein